MDPTWDFFSRGRAGAYAYGCLGETRARAATGNANTERQTAGCSRARNSLKHGSGVDRVLGYLTIDRATPPHLILFTDLDPPPARTLTSPSIPVPTSISLISRTRIPVIKLSLHPRYTQNIALAHRHPSRPFLSSRPPSNCKKGGLHFKPM